MVTPRETHHAMNGLVHEPASLPWLRAELQKKKVALEQEIIAHRHSLELLRQTEMAYGRFVPHQILKLLKANSILDISLGEQTERNMTIMFSDIRNFTPLSEQMSPRETFAFINSYLGEMEPVIGRYGGFVDKYIGDAIMAVFPNSADDGLHAAVGMLEQLAEYNRGRARAGYRDVRIGIGLNTGIVLLGTIGGTQRMEGTVLSDSVNLASRLENATKALQTPLLVSEYTVSALADASQFHIRFLDRRLVKGKQHGQSVYEVFNNDAPDVLAGKEATRPIFEEAVAFYHLQAAARALPMFEQCLRQVPEDRPAQIYLERCQRALATGSSGAVGEMRIELQWSEDFVVGVAQIDEPHRELVARLNSLAATVEAGGAADVDSMIQFLTDYVSFHFGDEEQLMREVAYPLMADHLREHQAFVKQIQALRVEISHGKRDALYLAFHVQLLLLDWFANHTTKTDRHLGRFIHGIRSTH